jgi:hypothetical protein
MTKDETKEAADRREKKKSRRGEDRRENSYLAKIRIGMERRLSERRDRKRRDSSSSE